MSKNVTVAGASYTAVPSVDLPATGGGTASFFDVSGTTATASDVATGKLFYAADGTLTTGTASGGGGGTITQDEDGYLTVSESGTGVSVLQTKSVTPSKTAQTITPDTGFDALASVTIQGDSDLIPGNIKNGVSIFNVAGTYEGEGGSVETQQISLGILLSEDAYYTDANMIIKTPAMGAMGYYISDTAPVGSIVVLYSGNEANTTSGVRLLYEDTSRGYRIYYVTDQHEGGNN